LLDCAARHLVHGSAVADVHGRLLRRCLVPDRPQIGKAPAPGLRPLPAEKTRCPSCLINRLRIWTHPTPPHQLRNFLSTSAALCSASRTGRFFPFWSVSLFRNRRLLHSGCRIREASSPRFISPAISTANFQDASAMPRPSRLCIAPWPKPPAPPLSTIPASCRLRKKKLLNWKFR